MSKLSLKGKLAVGFGVFAATALAILGVFILSTAIDTAAIAFIIFVVNAALHFVGGISYLGLYKTVAYGYLTAVVLRTVKFVGAVLR